MDADSAELLETDESVDNDNRSTVKKRPYGRYLRNWRYLVVAGAPVVFSPLLFLVDTKPLAGRAGYVVCVMAVYWMTEACPIAATALLPIVLYPLLGVMSSTRACSNYLRDGNALFLAGLVVAVAFERWNLHKRIALRVLLLVGTKPKWLLCGFMATTAFLSMWISNTATTAMMLPIVQAVLNELKNEDSGSSDVTSENREQTMETNIDEPRYSHSTSNSVQQQQDSNSRTSPLSTDLIITESSDIDNYSSTASSSMKESKAFLHCAKAFMLGIAYAANLGGTATLTGTGPNIILRGEIDRRFPSGPGIDFGKWFLMAFPNMLLLVIFAWVYLCLLYFYNWKQCCSPKLFACLRCNQDSTSPLIDRRESPVALRSFSGIIQEEYKKLGPIKFAEVVVLIDFIVLAILWLTRNPVWSDFFPKDKDCHSLATDTTAAMLMCFILFVFPSHWRISSDTERGRSVSAPVPRLLDWKSVEKNLPWGVLILMGGGFAMADGCEVSGLSDVIGTQFKSIIALSPSTVAFLVSIIVAMVTEVTANVATTTLFLPILSDVAVTAGLNPLLLMIPATIAASFAFMLPVATPPNAMVFSSGHLKVHDMVMAGFVMNIVSVSVTSFSLNTIGYALFDLGSFPSWANGTYVANRTC